MEVRKGRGSLEVGVTGSCEPLDSSMWMLGPEHRSSERANVGAGTRTQVLWKSKCGCCDPNTGPLEELSLLLTFKSSFHL